MLMRKTLIACCLLVATVSLSAQTRGKAADPISGAWTGDMGRDATNRIEIKIDFKFDGKAVTGTITGPPSPGTIDGTFDAKTGNLKFEVTLSPERPKAYFDGTLTDGSAAGKVMINDLPGDFKIKKDR